MNSGLCFPRFGFSNNHHSGSVPAKEYGGSVRKCIQHIREDAPGSDLDAAMVHTPSDKLPNGHNY